MITLLLVLTLGPEVFLKEVSAKGTESLVVWKDGQVVASHQPGKTVYVQSVTKVFVSLAAGRLMAQGKLDSIDRKLGDALPELREDPRGGVTLRHLLSHSSGIADARDEKGRTLPSLNQAKDYYAEAMKYKLVGTPGAEYRYNNIGIVYASLALEKVAGEPLHEYLNRELFVPLGIRSARWRVDSKGRCPFFMGLTISGEDLARVGLLVLQEGVWEGKRLLSADWIAQSTGTPGSTANSRVGLSWFFQPAAQPGRPVMVQHSGDGGNWLTIFPRHQLVAVRLRTHNGKPDPLENFVNLVAEAFLK